MNKKISAKYHIQNHYQNQNHLLTLYQSLPPFFLNLNLNLTVFFLSYIYTLRNKLVDDFFIYSQHRINSYASNASIMYIFFWYTITQKVCFYYIIKFSHFSF